MERITDKILNNLADRINEVTKNPITSYTKYKNGKMKSNVGNYYIDWAYGGVALYQMTNEVGGVADVFGSGYTTKRDLYNRLRAFLEGMRA